MKCIGGIGNAYGGLAVQEDNGKFYWMIGGYGGDEWEEIPQSLYEELIKFEDGK